MVCYAPRVRFLVALGHLLSILCMNLTYILGNCRVVPLGKEILREGFSLGSSKLQTDRASESDAV